MNVQQYQMDPAEAREKLREVRTAIHKKADEEYERLADAYAALAKGTPLINLDEAIAAAPFDEKGRPMLAVARADRKQIRFRWVRPDRARFEQTDSDTRWGGRQGRDYVIDAPLERPASARYEQDGWKYYHEGFALVPMIPPEVKNAVRFDASKTLILWEVEAWADTPIRAIPDRDPLLLRRIRGPLCAVLAAWDLTDLERMVMAGRRST